MRTLLLASLSIAALQNPADACGGSYVVEPTVFQLARGFALLNEEPTETPVWRDLAPGTYDSTQIADATPLATPRTITLVGPSGTKVVSSKDRVMIKRGYSRSKPTVALAIPNEGTYSVALAGRHANAKWIALDPEVRGSKAELDWVIARGVTLYRGYGAPMVYVRKLQNTAYDTVTVFAKDGGMVTFVRSGGHEVARFDGHIVGGLAMNGHAFAISSDKRGALTSFAL